MASGKVGKYQKELEKREKEQKEQISPYEEKFNDALEKSLDIKNQQITLLEEETEKFNDLLEKKRNNIQLTEEETNIINKSNKSLEEHLQTFKDTNKTYKDNVKSIKDLDKEQRENEQTIKSLTKKNDAQNKSLKESIEIQKKQDEAWAKIGSLKQTMSSAISAVNNFLEPWAKVDVAAAKVSRTIGLNIEGMTNLRKISLKTAEDTAGKFGATGDVLLKLQEGYNKTIGRSLILNANQISDLSAMSRLTSEEESVDWIDKLDKFGISASKAGSEMLGLMSKSSKEGVVFSKVSKDFRDNISIAQNYNFRNGIQGLMDMSIYASKIRLDMGQVAAFAEKVQTPEGAIQAAANLQVLGGQFSQMANPMAMLYEGLTDINALQDRMVKMFSGMGRFNDKTGEIKFSPNDQLRIKEASNAIGVDPSKMREMTMGRIRQERAEKAVSKASNISKDIRDLVISQAYIENGKWGVTDEKGKFKELSKITDNDEGVLRARTISIDDNVQDIAIRLRGFTETVSDVKAGKEAQIASGIEQFNIGRGIKSIYDTISTSNTLLKTIAAASVISGVAQAGNIIHGKLQGLSSAYGTLNNSSKGGGLTRAFGRNLNANKFAKSSLIAGGVAGAVSLANEYSKGNLKEGTRGGAIGSVAGTTIGSLIGAAALSFIPGGTIIGSMIGGYLGDAAGRWIGSKFDKKEEINTLNGKVNNASISIDNAQLEGGNIPHFANGGLISGPSHANGGKLINVEGGEMVISKNSVAMHSRLLNDINSKPLESVKALNYNNVVSNSISKEIFKYNTSNLNKIDEKPLTIIKASPIGESLKVTPSSNDIKTQSVNSSIKVEPININLSGTIKLDTGNQQVDISKLLNNPILIKSLTEMITKEISFNTHKAFNKKGYKKEFGY